MDLEAKEVLERLVKLEQGVSQILQAMADVKQDQQKMSGLVDAVSQLDRRHGALEQAVRAQWQKVDPIVHSDPSITSRIRANEKAISDLAASVGLMTSHVDDMRTDHQARLHVAERDLQKLGGSVKGLSEHVGEMRDTYKRMTWTVLAFVLLGILNAAVQFSMGGLS